MADVYSSDIVNVDISQSVYRSYVGDVLGKGEQSTNRYGANVYRSGSAVSLSGYTVTGHFIRRDLERIVITGVISGNTVYVDLTPACYAVQGTFSLAIKIKSGTAEAQTVRIVEGYIRLTEAGETPGESLPTMGKLMDQIATLERAADEAEAVIAEARDATIDTRAATIELSAVAAPSIIAAATGDVVTITDSAARPAVEVLTHITPVQEGSGDPSPDNVRPIKGWDKAEVNAAGVNLLGGFQLAEVLREKASATVDTSAGTVSYLAPSCASSPRVLSANAFKPNTRYTIILYGQNMHGGEAAANIGISYTDGTYEPMYFASKGTPSYAVYSTIAGKTVSSVFGLYWSNGTILYYDKCGIFEGVISADAFVPYQGQTLTAALPETVYGGVLDWVTGVLRVTHQRLMLDGTQTFHANIAENNRFVMSLERGGTYFEDAAALCDKLPYDVNTYYDTVDNFGYIIHQSYLYIRFGSGSDVNSPEKVAAYFAANPATLVYKLAEPYTIQLTPQQLSTLKGVNNVWSDAGETELTYVADTKMYIDQRISALLL